MQNVRHITQNAGHPTQNDGHTMHYGRTSVTLLKCDKIGLKIVALGLNLSPFCRRYENVINPTNYPNN